jgi:hypothetical protein
MLFAVPFGVWFALVPPAAAQLVAGDVFVVDSRAGANGRGAVFRVDPTTGQRTLVSDFGDAALGPIGRGPVAAAFDGAGLLVLDFLAGTDCTGGGT